MSDVPANGTTFRLGALERRVDRLEHLEPAVVRSELDDVKEDIKAIRSAQTWMIRTFVGLCISLSFAGVSMVLVLTNAHR